MISDFEVENDRFKIYDRCLMSDGAMSTPADVDTNASVACLDHLSTHNSCAVSFCRPLLLL